jgi:hypothetical protein
MSFDIEKLTQQMNRIHLLQDTIDKDTKENPLQGTYLESKESVIELYKLFLFYGLLEMYFPDYNR